MAAAANKAVFVFDNQKIFCYCKESHGSMAKVSVRGENYGEYSSDEFEASFKSYILYLKGTQRIAAPESCSCSCYLIILDNNISFAAAENILRGEFAFSDCRVCKSIDEAILEISKTGSPGYFGAVYEYGNNCYYAVKSKNTVKLMDKAEALQQGKYIIELTPEKIAQSLLETAEVLLKPAIPLKPVIPPAAPADSPPGGKKLTKLQELVLEEGIM